MAEVYESQFLYLLRRVHERVLLGILLGIVVIGFFLSDLLGNTIVVHILRIVFVILAVGIIYLLWSGTEAQNEEDWDEEELSEKDANIQNLIENQVTPDILIGEERYDFYQELNNFFDNLIKMIRATFVAHTAIIFLWDKNADQLRIEFFDSQSQNVQNGDLIETEGTLPGSVFLNGTEVLEQNIPEGGQTINYYKEGNQVRSFLGAPITMKGNVRGVLAVDSLVTHDFSEDDLNLLKAYERLISQGIQLLGERERSQLVNQSLKAQRMLLSELNEDLSYENVYSSIGSACREIYQFDRITIATIDPENEEMGRISKVIGQRDAMVEGYEFPLHEGLTGWVIRKNKPLLLGDLEKGDLFRPRYSKNDRSNYGLRSFLGAPISFKNQVFGAICLENKQPDFYTEWDQNILMLLTANMGLALLPLRLMPMKV